MSCFNNRVLFLTFRVELCSFSGYKIYPGHGRRYARIDGKVKAVWLSSQRSVLKNSLSVDTLI